QVFQFLDSPDPGFPIIEGFGMGCDDRVRDFLGDTWTGKSIRQDLDSLGEITTIGMGGGEGGLGFDEIEGRFSHRVSPGNLKRKSVRDGEETLRLWERGVFTGCWSLNGSVKFRRKSGHNGAPPGCHASPSNGFPIGVKPKRGDLWSLTWEPIGNW